MVAVGRPEHWEPPDPAQLLVSCRRVAKELDVPIWKANEICHCLERVYYAPGQIHYRVTRRSLNVFKDLLDQGLTMAAAREIMWRFRYEVFTPPQPLDGPTVDLLNWQARHGYAIGRPEWP